MSIPAADQFEAIANQFLELRQWQRLAEYCAERFRVAPQDPAAHYYAGRAAVALRNDAVLARHARELLQADGNLPVGHDLAGRYWLRRRRFDHALYHAQVLMRLVPEVTLGYYFAAAACFGMTRFAAALRLIGEARAIDPENPDLAAFQLRCEYFAAKVSSDFHDLDQRCFELLRLEPTRGSSHKVVGEFYFHSVGDMPRAIRYFTEALRLDPTLADCPGELAAASQQQNWIFRTLFWHRQVGRGILRSFLCKPWQTFFLYLLGILAMAVFAGLLLLSVVVLLIPSFLAEILWLPRTARSALVQRCVRWDPIRRGWPAWLRTGLLVAAITAYWWALAAMFELPTSRSGWLLAFVLLANFLGGLATYALRRARVVADSTTVLAAVALVGGGAVAGWWLGWLTWDSAVTWGGGTAFATLLAWAGLTCCHRFRRVLTQDERTPQVNSPPLPG